MCGIAGIIGPSEDDVLRRMVAALRHRGPDDEGFMLSPVVRLGMRRLEILDREGGRQPFWNPARTHAVVYNGELYNVAELRKELEEKGRRFSTRSDTEAIVHAFDEWGEAALPRLRGMFAIAWYDRARKGVLLARDRYGIKPLYYADAGGAFHFASEVRALLAGGRVARRLSTESLRGYLLFGSLPEPATLVDGVSSLPPGHRLWVEAGRAASRPEPWWTPPEGGGGSAPVRFPELLEDVVRRHLVADVPVGVFLSGGIDSGLLAGLAARAPGGVDTFSATFPDDPEIDEGPDAARIAARFGTRHHEVALSEADLVARIGESLEAMDQPSQDGFNTYLVSWAARQAGAKVALSGLGADELFGGYWTFKATSALLRALPLARKSPALARTIGRAAAAAGSAAGVPDFGRKVGAFLQTPGALPHPYYFTRLVFTPAQVDGLMGGSRPSATPAWLGKMERDAAAAAGLDAFHATALLEASSYLPSTLLRDADAMSMSRSLEIRVPFLDPELAAAVTRAPESWKRRGRLAKAPLADLYAKLRGSTAKSPRKRPFRLPWERWIRGPLRERVKGRLADPPAELREAMDPGELKAVWRAFDAGRTGAARVWTLSALADWVERHLGRV